MEVSGKKICVNELIQNVNEFDKTFGLKLKHPDIWIEPESFIESILAKTDMSIGGLICVINGIDADEWMDNDSIFSTFSKSISVSDNDFIEMSVIDWEDTETEYNTDSMIFKCRFLTYVLASVLGRTDNIIKREVKKQKHSKDERAIMACKSYISDVTRFVKIMLHPDGVYKNIILKMHEYVSYSRKKYDHEELKELLNNHMISLRENIKPGSFMEPRFLEDDLIIFMILKIAYLLATNDIDMKNLPNFKYIEGATIAHDMIKIISNLGEAIIKARKNGMFSPMFKSFMEARPYIWSDYKDEADRDLRVDIGLNALEYVSFVACDPLVTKFIKNMKRKGF